MTAENIEVLTQPILPLSLHGINPRSIMGDYQWKKVKAKYRDKANHHCMICDRYVPHVRGDWLECHEHYTVIPKTITIKNGEKVDVLEYQLDRFLSICHECHMYIHQGFLAIQVDEGTVTEDYFKVVIEKGDKLLQEHDMKKVHQRPDTLAYLTYEGISYCNDYSTILSEIVQNQRGIVVEN